jgi:hypothetical protein
MKLKMYILLFISFFFATATFAQGGVGRGNRERNYGGQTARPKNDKKYDFVAEAVKHYTKELKLDDFQQAAVRNVFEEQREPINELMATKGITADERRDRGRAINDRIGEKIKPLLSEEQFKKYTELQDKKKS